MTNIAEILNNDSPGNVVEAWYEANNTPRIHLGLSQIGHKCKRYLWYCHHGYKQTEIKGRVLRLFNLGNIIEDSIVFDLRQAGYVVHSAQKEVHFEYKGLRLVGHIDGIVDGLIESSQPHLLEIKSANEKSFKQLLKLGSYEKWNEKYKAQVHNYMLGLKLKRCLVIVENKNTSELYTERIRLDKNYIINALEVVFEAISMHSPPERSCPRADWYEAKWCGFWGECFK